MDGGVMMFDGVDELGFAGVPESNGAVGGGRGKPSVIGSKGESGDGTFMTTEGTFEVPGAEVTELDKGISVSRGQNG